MKTRFTASHLSLVMLLSLLPAPALAAEGELDLAAGSLVITASGYRQGEAGATLNLTLTGENALTGGLGCAGIYVAPDATLVLSGEGSLAAAGGASTWYRDASTVPDLLNGGEHFAYVIGYADGTVRPEANISRAEVAAVFFRLLKSEVRENSLADVSTFADVSEDTWYNKAVATLENLGLLQGRTPETFDPDAPITRAEYAALCARLDAGDTENSGHFTDISGHWAQAEIEHAAALGWIMGYEDGSFQPDNYITRAEAITLINRVLCRIPETEEDLLSGRKVWPDNRPGEWYYLAVQEATNSHNFRSKDELYEQWTQLRQGPDWTIYQGK